MPGFCLLLLFESNERGINCESIAKDKCCLNAPDCCEGGYAVRSASVQLRPSSVSSTYSQSTLLRLCEILTSKQKLGQTNSYVMSKEEWKQLSLNS